MGDVGGVLAIILGAAGIVWGAEAFAEHLAPVKTIRYYDRVGVLTATERTEAGYRLYDDDALGQYRFVRAAQAVGLNLGLGEIRQVIALRDRGETPCSFVAELQRLRDDLSRLAQRAEHLDARRCEPDLVCHVIQVAT